MKFLILKDCKRGDNCEFSHDPSKHEFTDTEKQHVKTEFTRLRKNTEIARERDEAKQAAGAVPNPKVKKKKGDSKGKDKKDLVP